MTDNSNSVLLVKIDNASAKLATGRMESRVFEKGGFEWTISAERLADADGVRSMDLAEITLRCDVPRARSWKCEVEVDMTAVRQEGMGTNINIKFCAKQHFSFTDKSCTVRYIEKLCWINNSKFWALEDCINNDKITIELHFNIISSERDDTNKFDGPNNRSNVILLVGDKKLHVSKELLTIHSPVFEALFFGDFVEKGKEEVTIEDVVYEEILDLLYVIYPGTTDVTDRTVHHILKLADRFQMERIMDQSMKHLLQSTGFDAMKKLLFADQYRLTPLKDHCLKSFASATDLGKKLQASPDFANFSGDMKASICERMVKLGF